MSFLFELYFQSHKFGFGFVWIANMRSNVMNGASYVCVCIHLVRIGCGISNGPMEVHYVGT